MTQRAEAAAKAVGAFVVGIVIATVGTLTFIDGRIERASAKAAVDTVQPVRTDLDAHLREVRAAGRYMHAYADWSSRTIYALCKANKAADCPSPPTWPAPMGHRAED
jgi:hypothetical protein